MFWLRKWRALHLVTFCRACRALSPNVAARPRIWRRLRASAASRWCLACSMQPAGFPMAHKAPSMVSPVLYGGCGDGETARLCYAADCVQRAGPSARDRECQNQHRFKQDHRKVEADRSGQEVRYSFLAAARPDRSRCARPNPKLRVVCSMSITPDNIDVAEATKRGIPVTVVRPIVAEATADIHFGLML